MSEREGQDFEEQVRQIARRFVYPSSPALRPVKLSARSAQTTALRRFSLGLAIALLILGAMLWTVPSARAAMLRFLQIGVIRILVPRPTPTVQATLNIPASRASSTPLSAQPSAPAVALTSTPTASTPSFADSLNLYGRTTLTQARASGIQIKMPTALGDPDAVYLQDTGGKIAILVWFDKVKPQDVRISLQIFTLDIFADKMPPRVLVQTQVKHKSAVWVEGAHFLRIKNGDYGLVQLVSQHALIWTEQGNTYRLETALPMEEAIKIAQTTP